MKSIFNKDNIYSLQILKNYNKTLDCNLNNVMNKYLELIIEYFKFILEKLKINNINISRFIILRGYDTITNIFLNLLFYTKNIDLTFYHCQKSYYLYVEFIEQISEDQHIYLQLNSRDATTYVYKKTIFEINNNIKTNLTQTNQTKQIFSFINEYSQIYKNIIEILLNKINLNEKLNETNMMLIDKLEVIYEKLNIVQFNINQNFFIINNLLDILYNYDLDINKFFDILFLLIKKLIKNNSRFNNIKNNICSENVTSIILNESNEKIVNFLIS
jgi:hypothetical protein